MSGYIMDSDYCTMVGVAVKDGAVYAMGNDWATSVPKLIRYSDKYLTDRTVVMSGVGVNVYAGATEMAYDATIRSLLHNGCFKQHLLNDGHRRDSFCGHSRQRYRHQRPCY